MRESRVLVLLDRDGTINRRIIGGYVTRWGEFVFLPGVLRALADLTEAGVTLAVVTNQAAVGKGLVTVAELEAIHRRMTRAIERAGGRIAGVYVCPHLPEARCPCRKPRPGLLERATEELGYAPGQAFMVGDSPTDIEAGRHAGCRTIRLAAEGSESLPVVEVGADCVVPDLAAAAAAILAALRNGTLPTGQHSMAGLPPAGPRVSVVIVNWNTRDLTRECLSALAADLGIAAPAEDGPARDGTGDAEVWVVDNASHDGSARMIREQYPAVRLIANRENVGFARGSNQAIRQGVSPYVLLLNPDTRVRPGAIGHLLRFMDEHPHAGAAGARLVSPDGKPQASCHPAPSLFREAWRLCHLDRLYPLAEYRSPVLKSRQPRVVEVVSGACFLVRREALDAVGLLDEDYFIYTEEVDLCRRLRRAGWRVYWVPDAEVVHHGGASTRQVPAEMFLHLYQSKLVYFRKHHGAATARAYKLVLLAAAVGRLLLSPLACFAPARQRGRLLALAARYARLVRALPRL